MFIDPLKQVLGEEKFQSNNYQQLEMFSLHSEMQTNLENLSTRPFRFVLCHRPFVCILQNAP